VSIEFDPAAISYDRLLEAFWNCHDPTQHNRQGPDIGTQYRSAIFYHDDAQRQAAEGSKQALEASGQLTRPIATRIEPAGEFWRAEEYHQQYIARGGTGTCHL
jgi:peptide-methionine (S)-S-oxide reductase